MSHHRWAETLSIVLVLGCAVAAQGDRSASTANPVTVVGCLQRIGQSGTLGTTASGAAARPEEAGKLANSQEPAPGYMLAQATDASTSLAKDARPTTYVLVGDAAKLDAHLGERVRVQGTMTLDGRGADTGVPEVAGTTGGSHDLKSSAKRPRVAAIETVAQKCSAK